MEKISKKQGIGEIIAGGSKRLIKEFPKLSPLISQVKGLEQSAYDARVAMTMALGYATSDIGAHHTRAWPIAFELEAGKNWSMDKKVDLVIYHQSIRPLFDMLGVCRLAWIELGFPEQFYETAYQAVTGVDYSLKDLLDRSRRVYDLTRLIGNKLGISRKDDYPAERCFSQPVLRNRRVDMPDSPNRQVVSSL
jgi:aldehyde:ferredoxin oxidoreductase